MAKKDLNMHLTAERIQAFLDDMLPPRDRVHVEEHAASCAPCQAEFEAWQLLYSELRELPELGPSEGFADRVLAKIDVAAPKLVASASREASEQGAWGWLRRRRAGGAEHLGPHRLQDFIDGALPQPQMARIKAHLDGCGACAREAATWRELFDRVEALPELAPSAGFAPRVMAQVRIGRLVRAPAAVSTPARVLAWTGRLLPRTQRAWAAISGVAVTPAAVLALVVYTIFSSPAVTLEHLASFLWWQVSGAASSLGGWAADTLLESAFVFHTYSVLEALASAPALAALMALSVAAATSVSGWVLYRNLRRPPTVNGHYAGASI